MTQFITQAAKLYLDAAEQGLIAEPDLELDGPQLVTLNDELVAVRTADDNKHSRAERGRIAVELFGFNDDIETMAADVIADILHWVSREAGNGSAMHAHYRGARYYDEES